MNYQEYTSELLENLGAKPCHKGCEYIISGICLIHNMNKYDIPDSEMIYTPIATKYRLAPVAIENSMRNVIQYIWKSKTNLELMREIFGEYNLIKRPCNIEFLMLLYNYMKYHMSSENITKEWKANWQTLKALIQYGSVTEKFRNTLLIWHSR